MVQKLVQHTLAKRTGLRSPVCNCCRARPPKQGSKHTSLKLLGHLDYFRKPCTEKQGRCKCTRVQQAAATARLTCPDTGARSPAPISNVKSKRVCNKSVLKTPCRRACREGRSVAKLRRQGRSASSFGACLALHRVIRRLP